MPLRKIPISYQILEKAPGAYACFLKGFLSFFKLDFINDFWYSVLLMGDDPPLEIENLLYRFLTSLFRRRLGILAAQGEGL